MQYSTARWKDGWMGGQLLLIPEYVKMTFFFQAFASHFFDSIQLHCAPRPDKSSETGLHYNHLNHFNLLFSKLYYRCTVYSNTS